MIEAADIRTPESVATAEAKCDSLQRLVMRQFGDCTLYNADCLDVLAGLKADAVITDPPYGVNLGNHGAAKDRRTNRVLVKDGYGEYDDTPENYDAVVVPAIRLALTISKRALVFCAMIFDKLVWMQCVAAYLTSPLNLC